MFGITGTLNYHLCDGFINIRCGIDGLLKIKVVIRLSTEIEKSVLNLGNLYIQKESFYHDKLTRCSDLLR